MLIFETLSGSIRFRNGTEIDLSDKNVISASCKRQCCPEGRFEIGGVYAAVLSMSCRLSGTNSFNIRGAKIVLKSKYAGELKEYGIGTFWVTEAHRTGDIFNITALDAVSWLDTSSMDVPGSENYSNAAEYLASQGYGVTLESWCGSDRDNFRGIIPLVNSLVKQLTGAKEEENILSWSWYPENERIYTNHHYYHTQNDASFFLLNDIKIDQDSGRTKILYKANNADSPRDLCRYIAQLIAGFIYAHPENGMLTFGQFGEPRNGGVQEIYTHEIEYDSCEIADFRLFLYSVHVQAEYFDNEAGDQKSVTKSLGWSSMPDYNTWVPFRVQIDSNPFLDGFAQYHLDEVQGLVNLLWDGLAMNRDGETSKKDDGSEDWYQFQVRPFHCKVHSEKRFHLGQKIRIHYQAAGESEEKLYESIITSVTWNFRGGHYIACGGEDNRTMADCLRVSKADKALKEARSRCAALEKNS